MFQKWLQKYNVTNSGYRSTMLPKVVTAVLLGTIMSRMLLHLSLGFLSSTWAQFHNNLIWLNFNPKYSSQNYTFFSQVYLGILKDEYNCLPIVKHQLYLLEQRSESFDIWSAIILDLY